MIFGEQQDNLWPFIASIIYLSAWCLSFYGQIYENFKLKSVQGFSLDYLVLSFTGHAFYTIYTNIGFWTDLKGAGTVVLADLLLVYHTMTMVTIEAIQCLIYQKGSNKLSPSSIGIVISLCLAILVEWILTWTGALDWYEYWNPVSTIGYAKLVLTLIKCTPAAYWNYKRKSTVGWSISAVLFDLTGGAFSMTSGGLSAQNGLNLTKCILGFISIAFDLIFCFQHYCLYMPKVASTQDDENSKNESLLSNEEKKSNQNLLENDSSQTI